MLPDELWYQVFTTLDWRSVIQCEKVCRKWKQIANDEYLWRKLLLENFLDATTTDDIEQIQSYKHLFFKHFCLQKNWDEGIFQEFCFVAPAAILQARLNGNLLFTGALNTKIYIFNLSEAVYDKSAIKTSKFHHQQLSQLQAKAKKKVVSKYVPPHLRGNDYELPNLHSEKIYIAPLPEPVEVSGHTDSVISLEIFDKRKLFMSCSNDSYLKLWDYSHFNAKPELVHTFVGHQRSVRALQFYEGDNGLYCISSSKDRSVKVWDIDNKTLLHSFDMSGPVHAFQASAGTIVRFVCFVQLINKSPYFFNHFLYNNSSDSAGAVSIRDFSTMDPIANFQASSSWITTLFFDHASKLLFTGCYSGKTKVIFLFAPSLSSLCGSHEGRKGI